VFSRQTGIRQEEAIPADTIVPQRAPGRDAEPVRGIVKSRLLVPQAAALARRRCDCGFNSACPIESIATDLIMPD
jgi:hypothetical protein